MKKPLIILAITFGVIFLSTGSENNTLTTFYLNSGFQLKLLQENNSTVNNSSISDRYAAWEKRYEYYYYNLLDSTDTTKKTKPLKVPPYTRDRWGNPFSSYYSSSPFLLGNPSGLKLNIQLDTAGKYFNINEKIGDNYFRNPSRISFDDYTQLRYRNMDKSYWKSLSYSQDGEDDLTRGESTLIPKIKLGPIADRLFGGDVVDIRPNGTLVGTLGGRWQRINDPERSIRNQRTGTIEFDQQISMNLVGKIGEKLQISTNFDTKSTFQFEQKYNFGYTAFEEDIIQEVQLGNVSFQSSNSLIAGAQNLFGLSTKLRFGKLWINAVASSQRGTTEQLVVQNGSQSKNFELQVNDYDNNRHFFLNHFFRDNYNDALRSLPAVTSNIQITNLEVYVTNRTNETQTLRTVTAYADLGEASPYNSAATGTGTGNPADNSTNGLYDKVKNFRDPDGIADDLAGLQLKNGEDFEILRAAKKLSPSEYVFHSRLGYLSLQTPLQDDEVIAVSYSYNIGGSTYQVGELTRDYQNLDESNTVHLKLLSPSTIRTDLPIWDLMMKNIYDLNSGQLSKDNFELKIIYKDQRTGNDNPSLQEGTIKNIPLVEVLNADQLNPVNVRQNDANFDFVENITVDVQNGRIIFPVVEPFGDFLASKFGPTEQGLVNKYVFSDLYDKTKNDAIQVNSDQSQYFLTGNIQSGASNDIKLPGINIAPNSVNITAGSAPLTEGVDYQVDYQFGSVKILNEAILNSGKEIIIQFERQDLFAFQTKNLFGIDAQYYLTKDIKFTGTLMHLSERPLISRISIGSEPTKNTILGLGVDYTSESRMITKIVDKLPFISTKEKSNINFRAEVAQLRPGSPKLIGTSGTSYIDDFEATENSYDLRRPREWVLGSTPQLMLPTLAEMTEDPLSFNYRRAKIAWYTIDNVFYNSNGQNFIPEIENPEVVTGNHYSRAIGFKEVFPGKDEAQVQQNERSFDIAYFPNERGAYNYKDGLVEDNSTLYFENPEQVDKEAVKRNFGAITKSITQNVDFDNINIQYIEFWLMDPFIKGNSGAVPGRDVISKDDIRNYAGGDLYFNLGSVSEDLIPDERHFFENGLPVDGISPAPTEGPFFRTPSAQYLTNAFGEDRTNQDVGFDGLNNENEALKFGDFLDSGSFSPVIRDDPSGDDFFHYNDNSKGPMDIIERYKNFNNNEGNSISQNNFIGSNFPDNEDLNRDNTVNSVEQYFRYKVRLSPDSLEAGLNPYVVDKVTHSYSINNNPEDVNWYLFRIPIRTDDKVAVNGINSFKSMKFLRMFLTGWEDPVVLRMVNFQLVGAQWRVYTESLLNTDQVTPNLEPYDAGFTVSTVNIEENSDSDGEGIPYDTPPGLNRDFDTNSNVARRLNEQSLRICVDQLKNSDSRAVFKNVDLDFLNYKRLKMEIHAESFANDPSLIPENGDIKAFIRLGTDFTENFYEIEVPLEITPGGTVIKEQIWPRNNEINIAFDSLFTIKSERNRFKVNPGQIYPDPSVESNIGRYKISVRGNPDLSAVKTMMIGIKNPETAKPNSYKACLWVNELRVTDFDTKPGTAFNASVKAKLADFATVNASVRYSTVGYGNIQNRISERSRSTDLDYDVSANVALDKILLNKVGISLPLFVSYEKSTSDPNFDPLDKDTPLEISALKFEDEQEREEYKDQARDVFERKTISLNNVKKIKMKEGAKSYPWDVENLNVSAGYTESKQRNANLAEEIIKNWKVEAGYNYASKAKPLEPFKNVKFLNSPYLQLIKDFNINLIPSSVSIKGNLNRNFRKTQNWNDNRTTEGIAPNFQKSFVFNRDYTLRWQLSKNLGLDYNAKTNAVIDEPEGDIGVFARDSIITNLKNFGRMNVFNQGISANYKLPLDKFPLTNWVSADARYQAGYSWTAGTLELADSIGNVLQNNNSIAVNGKVDLNKIYNKIPVLKKLNETKKRRRPTNPIREMNNALRQKKEENNDKISNYKEKIQNIEEKLAATKNDSIPPDKEEEEVVLDTIPKVKKLYEKIAKLEQKNEEITVEIAENKKKKVVPKEKKELKLLQGLGKMIISVKNINVSYSETNATILPGFNQTPKFFGFDEDWSAPGLPFILGSQDPSIRQEAIENDWLVRGPQQTSPFTQNTQKQLNLKTQMEPFKDFKIALEAKKTKSASYSENFGFDTLTNSFFSFAPIRTGNYSVSFIMLKTAFKGDDENNVSPLYNDFQNYRSILLERLTAANPNFNDTTSYTINDQDVIIPAFIAAYTGEDPNDVDLSPFPKIPIPNWKVTFTGLKNLKGIKEKFKTFSITHGYQSKFEIGNYQSNDIYGGRGINFDLSVSENDLIFASVPIVSNDVTIANRWAPIYTISQVVLTEMFSPLIGINMKTNNNVQIKFDYKTGRHIALNISNAQVTETKNSDITFDFGLTKKGMRLPLKTSTGGTVVLKNDVTLRMAFTLRNTKTVQRRLDENSPNGVNDVTAKNNAIQFKPTITYKVNKRADIQFFFERSITDPNPPSFRRANTAFGLQFRFSMTQ